jgi:glycerophosphoryl diester phosphodiesterase
VLIFGHRGASGNSHYGENTIAAFGRALRHGAGGLEFDIRRCGDGQLVVIHDDTIDRTTTGKGAVASLTYDELRRFDAGFGEPIPLLSDVLDKFGGSCLLNIELKEPGLAGDLRELIQARELEDGVIVSCFEWNELAPFPPAVPVGLLTAQPAGEIVNAARRLRASAIHPRSDCVTPELIATAHESGLKIYVWTVNDLSQLKLLRQLGVDGIFTDLPELCSTSAL